MEAAYRKEADCMIVPMPREVDHHVAGNMSREIDLLAESMEVFCEETQKTKPRDLVLVDFQTLELYAIQEHNAGYFIRDYYVEIESEEDGVEVKAFYCPKLNNGKKDGE